MADGAMTAAFPAVIGGASLLAVTARRLRPSDRLPSLEGWALADRGLGAGWTWLPLGGTVPTAYTFTAVPGPAYGNGAPAFFTVPYTVLLGGVWILQIFPAVAVGPYTRWPHPRAGPAGWAAGMAAGTYLMVREGFSSIVPLGAGAGPLEICAGVAALLLNLTVAVAVTAVLARLGVPRGADATDLPSRLLGGRRPRTGAHPR
ncbi:hypothetical protein ACIRPR_07985 [Streptomyces griseoflavus]|uniref:hypothetical protein n=1 Tax=Streptomyces griseoflavus TaxID=35619 RepID=UPI0038094D46